MTVAVRDFGVPLTRSGDLRQESGGALPIDVGTEIHERIQARLKDEDKTYESEVSLSTSFKGKRYDIKLRGRCDGLSRGDEILLEEIKSSFHLAYLKRSLDADSEHPYILQVKLYGWLYQSIKGETPRLQLRLVDSKTLEEEIYPVSFDFEKIGEWIARRLDQIEIELTRYNKIISERKKLGKKLHFPFREPRKQQIDLMNRVEQSLVARRRLMLQAPTGLGKTAGVLYPALKEGLSRGAPVVYVAPKNSQFQAAVDFGKMLQKNKVKIKVLVLTSKTKACRADAVLCQSSTCPLTLKYHDKVEASSAHIRDVAKHVWDLKYFEKISENFEICPYEIGMERIPEADLIICDYNYIFSPRANFLDRYLDPVIPRPKPYLVIDEAHNLYERVMENYSPEIRLSALKAFLESSLASDDKRFVRVIRRSIGLMADINPRLTHAVIDLKLESVALILEETVAILLSRWGQEGLPSLEDPLFQFFQQWSELFSVMEMTDAAIPLIYKREGGDEILKAQCLDPHNLIAPLYDAFAGVVAFSATLKPFDFYRHVSGFAEADTDVEEFASPFPRRNKKIMIIPQVETNYRERTRHYPRIAEIIRRTVRLKTGPYLVFFSSYGFLREVESELKKDEEFEIYAQSGSLSESGVRALRRMVKEGGKTQLILAVQGGSLSEGIDFKGDGLRGVFIVGPAVPQASFERKLLQEYFDKRAANGRAFAYVFPAMTRSIQAAGRIVRDESERGLILLLDPRFLEKDYEQSMPEDWFVESSRELVARSILKDVEDFWSDEEKPLIDDQGLELSIQ